MFDGILSGPLLNIAPNLHWWIYFDKLNLFGLSAGSSSASIMPDLTAGQNILLWFGSVV